MLEIVLRRLEGAGVREAIINTHHCAAQIEEFVAQRDPNRLRITLSHEERLLDTGGGLKKAAWFFDSPEPFLVHNVDVLSDIDLLAMVDAHERAGSLVSLAAKKRPTSRPLVFDAAGNLCGRRSAAGLEIVRSGPEPLRELGFCGIQVISPQFLAQVTEEGAFSVITSYLRLARAGKVISLWWAAG